MRRWRIGLSFAWFDFWIGGYFDRTKRVLYVCPLPCVVIRVWREALPDIEIRVGAVMDALHRLAKPETFEVERALRDMRDYAESLRNYTEHRLKGFDCK